jgi:hypothetical protein
MKSILWIAMLIGLSMTSSLNCKDEFNKLLAYDPGNSDPMNDRVYIFYASMAKHKHDLGSYQYCSEEGSKHELKYSLLALRVYDFSDNKNFIYGGSCVPDQCTEDEIMGGFEPQMKEQYSDQYTKSIGLTVSFPDKEEPSANVGTFITISIFILVTIMIIVGTIVDRSNMFNNNIHVPRAVPDINADDGDERRELAAEEHQKKTKVGNFFRSFSIPLNFRRIFYDDFTMNNELRIFNGIFVIALLMIILNNIYFTSIMYGIVEGSKLEEWESKFPHFTFLRLQLSYDAYFFSVGFACCVKLWTLFYVKEHKGYVLVELFRYMYRRFIPMMFLLLYALFIFQFTNSGPLFQFCYQTFVLGSSEAPL